MFLLFLLVATLTRYPIPDGKYVLVNGFLGNGEWESSINLPLDRQTELMAQKDSQSLFLAVIFKESTHTGLDLYVKCRSDVRMLHVSSSLGERIFKGGKWSETVWGNNKWWTANPVCVFVDDEKQQIVAPEAFEFQLERSHLGREVALYFHFKRPEKWLPTNASPDTTDHWVHLTLE